jgi:hypothetical protein
MSKNNEMVDIIEIITDNLLNIIQTRQIDASEHLDITLQILDAYDYRTRPQCKYIYVHPLLDEQTSETSAHQVIIRGLDRPVYEEFETELIRVA